MESQPVSHTETPAYPTRREVLAGAATFALASFTGCWQVLAEDKDGKLVVAPLFEHGTGRGATGCVVVSPPVFLSEEEGMQIVREELAKQGIDLKADVTLTGVKVPLRQMKYESVEKPDGTTEHKSTLVEVEGKAEPLKLDGVDAAKKVGVEFVSHEDYYKLGGPHSMSTVQQYDLKEVAQYVGTLAKKQGKDQLFLGFFYDPMTKMNDFRQEGEKTDWNELNKRGKVESVKLLRQQTQDFVA
jgi:hypothetical protein